MEEQDFRSEEFARCEMDGTEPRDDATYTAWRQEQPLDECIDKALIFYGSYMPGQTNGFGEALSLPAMLAAFEIDQVPHDERADLARLTLLIHRRVIEIHRIRARQNGAD